MAHIDDRELTELIRRGASSWRGWSGSASTARYRRRRGGVRWRSAATLSAAVATALLVATSLAGGPGHAFRTLVFVTTRSTETPAPTPPSPSPKVEPGAPANAAPPAKKTEPAPTARTEPPVVKPPTPTPGHEPGPTTQPSPTPANK